MFWLVWLFKYMSTDILDKIVIFTTFRATTKKHNFDWLEKIPMCNGKNSQCAMENFPLCSEESQCALLIFVRHTEEGGLRQVWHLSFFLKTSLNVISRELLLFCGWSIRATQTNLVIFFILNMKVQRQSQDSEGRNCQENN